MGDLDYQMDDNNPAVVRICQTRSQVALAIRNSTIATLDDFPDELVPSVILSPREALSICAALLATVASLLDEHQGKDNE